MAGPRHQRRRSPRAVSLLLPESAGISRLHDGAARRSRRLSGRRLLRRHDLLAAGLPVPRLRGEVRRTGAGNDRLEQSGMGQIPAIPRAHDGGVRAAAHRSLEIAPAGVQCGAPVLPGAPRLVPRAELRNRRRLRLWLRRLLRRTGTAPARRETARRLHGASAFRIHDVALRQSERPHLDPLRGGALSARRDHAGQRRRLLLHRRDQSGRHAGGAHLRAARQRDPAPRTLHALYRDAPPPAGGAVRTLFLDELLREFRARRRSAQRARRRQFQHGDPLQSAGR